MRTMNQGTPPISGSWTHSFEEDEGDVQVYRPTDSFAFPPARRGRDTLEFGNDGTLTERTPGPDDRTIAKTGRWTALGMGRVRLEGTAEMSGRVIEIMEHTPQLLRIRMV